jgi:hypothetical protein
MTVLVAEDDEVLAKIAREWPSTWPSMAAKP